MWKQKIKSRLQLKLYEAPKAQAQWKTIITGDKNIFIHIASFPSYSMVSLKHMLKTSTWDSYEGYIYKILGAISLCVQ